MREKGPKGKPRTSSRSSCRALVAVDSQRVRKRLIKELKSAERRFEKAEAEYLNHQQVDLPEYRRWHHLVLGPLEQEILRHRTEFKMLDRFLDGLREEQFIQHRPVRELLVELLAYAEAHDDGKESNRVGGEWSPVYLMGCGYALWLEPRKRKYEAAQEKRRRAREARNARLDKQGRHRLEDELIDFMEENLDGMFGDLGPGGEFWEGNEAGLPLNRRNKGPREQEFRSLYRKLCRALHPDVAGEATPERHRLWLEVQDAHEARDLERLEALHAALEMKGDPQGKHSTCARIIAATKECLAGLRSLQRALRAAKKQMSWRFAALGETERAQLAERVTHEMRREARDLKRGVDSVQQEYVYLIRSVKLPRKRKIRRPEPAAAGGRFGSSC